MSKQIVIHWTVDYEEEVEVPDEWDWDGSLDALLEFTDMSFQASGQLTDWGAR